MEVDRQLRLILAVIGRLKDYSGQSPSTALDLIGMSISGSEVPTELRDTLQAFWDVRNAVVHGGQVQSGYTMRAVDYGLRILRMLQAIPRPAYIVIARTELYSDSACLVRRMEVTGIILESFGLNGESHGRNIHPSRRSYIEGQSVSWEWALGGAQWGETWYRDPFSLEYKFAWTASLEFVGRPLEAI